LCGDGSVIEAWHVGGVKHTCNLNADHTEGTLIDVFDIDGLTAEQRCTVEEFLRANVGFRYDFRGVLKFISRRKHRNPSRWFCSELVFAALQHAKVDVLQRITPAEVYPGLLCVSPRVAFLRRHTVARYKSHRPIIPDLIKREENDA